MAVNSSWFEIPLPRSWLGSVKSAMDWKLGEIMEKLHDRTGKRPTVQPVTMDDAKKMLDDPIDAGVKGVRRNSEPGTNRGDR